MFLRMTLSSCLERRRPGFLHVSGKEFFPRAIAKIREKRTKAEGKRKERSLLQWSPGTSAVFGDESSTVPRGDRGTQGVAHLDADPIWSWN